MAARKTPASTTSKKSARGKKPIGLTSAIGPKATVMVVICVMAGGIAIAARQQTAKAKDDAATVMTAEASPSTAAVPAAPKAVRAVASPMPTVVEHASATRTPVTVTGCLERADGGFRLKDTTGQSAPKSRSWKSGFLKKGNAAIDVVDPSHELSLGNQVGRRVSVSGVLVDREMRAEAVRRLGSCKAE